MSDLGTGVLAGWPAALHRFLESQGVDANDLFKSCNVDVELLKDQTNRISAVDEVSLWFKAEAILTEVPHFGLLVPAYLYQNSFYSLSLAMQSSDNLREALSCMIRCMDMINEVVGFYLIEEGERHYLRYTLPAGLRTFLAHSEVDAAFATLYHTISKAIENIPAADETPLFSKVYMMRPTPKDPSIYEEYFNAPVVFGHKFDQLEISSEVLTHENPAANRELATLNEQIAKDYISRAALDPLIIKTNELLINYLRQGISPRQEQLASDLHVSLRQLQRKFNEAGETYTNLLNKVRHTLACEALKNSNRSISQIAQEVGFSDQSNFTKSFKRWENQSPADYRKRFRGQ